MHTSLIRFFCCGYPYPSIYCHDAEKNDTTSPNANEETLDNTSKCITYKPTKMNDMTITNESTEKQSAFI